MNTGDLVREKLFYTYAKCCNQDIINVLAELDRQYYHNIDDEIDDKLNLLVKHVVKTTPYYSNYQEKSPLADFPVIKKSTLKKEDERFISNSFSRSELHTVYTSGSSGAPMRHYLDNGKKLRRALETIFFNQWANYRVGMQHILNGAGVTKSKISRLIQNEIVFDLSALKPDWLERIRVNLKSKKVQFYIGYSSALKDLTEYCYANDDQPEDFNMQGIIAIGENLPELTREKAEKLFRCPVLSRYATLEFGVLAHECQEEKKLHLNRASYIVELLEIDSDKPVVPGEVGRVVVTDLFSFGMPLLRYDTGDLAVMSKTDCYCGRKGLYFESIEGRLLESLISEKGMRISGFIIIQMMRYFESVIEYRLIQKDLNSFDLLLQVKSDYADEALISRQIKNILGNRIDLKFSYVDMIPPLKSGKRPYVVNDYLNMQICQG